MRAGSVPLLIAKPAGGPGPFPAVLWFHGLGVSKNTHQKELQQLAHAGFLAVGVDAAGHGERGLPTLHQRIADASQEEALRLMLPLAELTARDVPLAVRTLVEQGMADERRISLAGVSMGAYVVYRAVAIVQGIRAAVALLGSPEWPEGISPHWEPEAFRQTAILSITAERDVNVPPDGARAFHDVLDDDPERTVPARYIELPGAPHLLDDADWMRAMTETVAWLRRFNS
jgi:dienelactone hydrolase